MAEECTIVLDDPDSIREFCGINDANITLIEELLGSAVYYRGNEISIRSDSHELCDEFRKLTEHIRLHMLSGETLTSDKIRSLHTSIHLGRDSELTLLKENVVNIPGGLTRVFPRNITQAACIRAMDRYDINFSIGPAGTGKTFLAVAHALKEVLGKKKRKLILTRPVVEAGESLGYLPGDLTQKIAPYLHPLYDAMDMLIPYDIISRMEENRVLEIAPLAYMRGRSLSNCYVILDEAQNTTKEQMKMFLTRLGENSRAVITGDITQIDLPSVKQSGLLHARSILKGIGGIYFTEFHSGDVVRHPLVRKIIQAYAKETKENR